MIKQLEESAVRIYTASQKVVGTGFLVSQEYVLTCAHVVAEALGLGEDISEVPDARVQLDFPIIAPNQILTAHVVFWQPPLPNGSGDIVGLQLDSDLPPDASAVRLVFADEVWDDDFRAFGFPQGHDNGLWAFGKLLGRQASGWVQIQGITQTGTRVQQGFSGGAVWDMRLDGVVGMVVAEVTEPSSKIAFMIPTRVMVEAWPTLHQRTIPPCPYRGLSAFEEEL